MEKKIDEKVLEVQKWLNKHYIDILTSSEYGRVEENGQTSWNVLNGLIIALQHELEIKDLSPTFGPQTYEKLLALGNLKINTKSKIIPIIQGACWASGYSGGSKHGTFDLSMGRGIRKLQAYLGINQDGIINAKLLKALFTMNAYIKLPDGYDEVRKFQQWLNRTYASKTKFHYVPCDGVYSRETQEGIIYAIQYECQLGDVANGWFGPTTSAKLYEKTKEAINNNFKNKNLEKIFVGLFACYNNGIGLIYNRLGTKESKEKIKVFQKFTKINVNGAANFETWCELLVSTGDPNRHTEAIDYSFKYSKVDGHGPITQDDITMMKNDGIKYVGRYLTNECGLEPVEERCWDKELKIEERDMLLANGISRGSMKNESEFINKVLNELKKLLINILILMILIKLSLYAENGILVTLLVIRVVIVFNIMYIILKLLIYLFKMLKHPKLTIKEIKKCTTESEEI